MNWKIKSVPKIGAKERHQEIISAVAKNRGIDKSQWGNFINPPHPHKIGLKIPELKLGKQKKRFF